MCATMFVFGIFFAVSQNVNHITKTIEEQQGMEVFILDEATVEQKEELKNKIRSNQYVNTITEKSKEDALETIAKSRKIENTNVFASGKIDTLFRAVLRVFAPLL